ncbi:MAG: hypothetical protein M3Z75_19650 [Actinomycetota bacterium]|nr:hypothetical protein [Actinomycetota bacterium]
MPFPRPDRDPKPGRTRRAKIAAARLAKVEVSRATHRLPRLARWLTRRNALRRPVDRIEGAVLVTLYAAFGVLIGLACVFGAHTYQAQRTAAAGLRPAAAQLVQAGPPGGRLGLVGQAEARWPGPAGGEHTGMLSTAIAPDISGAAAGARIAIWLNPSGQPVPPPADQVVKILYALAAGATLTAIAALALLILYRLCRLVLDRRRLAAWDSAWARTGPRWTTRR